MVGEDRDAAVLTSNDPARLEEWLRGASVEGSGIEVTIFPSGSLDLLVRLPERVVLLQADPDRSRIGLTLDLGSDEGGFNDGHPFVFDTVQSAVVALRAALR